MNSRTRDILILAVGLAVVLAAGDRRATPRCAPGRRGPAPARSLAPVPKPTPAPSGDPEPQYDRWTVGVAVRARSRSTARRARSRPVKTKLATSTPTATLCSCWSTATKEAGGQGLVPRLAGDAPQREPRLGPRRAGWPSTPRRRRSPSTSPSASSASTGEGHSCARSRWPSAGPASHADGASSSSTQKLRPPYPDGAYGVLALGISAFQPKLNVLAGRAGQVAIHGTNEDRGSSARPSATAACACTTRTCTRSAARAHGQPGRHRAVEARRGRGAGRASYQYSP